MKNLRQNEVMQSKNSQLSDPGLGWNTDSEVHYKAFIHIVHSEDNAPYWTTGIAVLSQGRKNGTIVSIIPDVSTDSSSVKHLVKRMNRAKVPLAHFYDIVNDFLTTQFI